MEQYRELKERMAAQTLNEEEQEAMIIRLKTQNSEKEAIIDIHEETIKGYQAYHPISKKNPRQPLISNPLLDPGSRS